MTSKIIKIEPIHQYFNVNWMLGSFCNYNCSYCPDELHDTTSKPHDLATMQTVWRNIYNKSKHLQLPYKISFTGGEVTANKQFLPLIEWLRSNYPEITTIGITTNGSASVTYYLKLAKVVESISFSTHSEFMVESEFFDKAIKINEVMIRPEKSFHVNVMDEVWNKSGIERYNLILTEHNISNSINKIEG
jgi:MoaA/NifB/PqqE/SkfB family radical SAM enzyme